MKKVCIIGLGYIGLPTALVAAKSNLSVVGVDINTERIKTIMQGKSPIEEPGIEQELKDALQSGHFTAQTTYETADFYIMAVPTPFTEDKKADLSYIYDATSALAKVLKKGDTVIVESTIPVGTTKKIALLLAQESNLTAGEFFIAHCPERVLPGNIFHELRINDRIIGGIDRGSTRQAATFYKHFVSGDLYLTTAETAEMTKLVENSYRDVCIAMAHQVASMAYEAGLDPYEVIELANKHPRVKLLRPTCGVGGHCLAVDPWFLIETFPQQSALLKAARLVNDTKPYEVIKKIEKKVQEWKNVHQKSSCTVLSLGLTYKANVDDIRESPSLHIAHALADNSEFSLLVCDPHVDNKRLNKKLAACKVDFTTGIEKADIIVCLVAHDEFKIIEKRIIAHKKVLDFCGLLYSSKKQTVSQEQEIWPALKSEHALHESNVITHQLKDLHTIKQREHIQ